MKKMTVPVTGLLLLVMLASGCTPGGAPAPLTASPAPGGAGQPAGNVARADWQARWETTLAAAKQEGEVLAYLNAPSEARMALQ
ncbi:MAG: hypothetical protein HY673_06605, partial [Chloroflexi bacterium]|nr:hypothetical protein [Chloroflexota bacterium]